MSTEAALLQHVKRAILQSVIWKSSLSKQPDYPPPDQWGWTKHTGGGWLPFWTELPEVSDALRQLVSCGCTEDVPETAAAACGDLSALHSVCANENVRDS